MNKDKDMIEKEEEDIEFLDEDSATMNLILEDGTEMECEVIGIFEVDDVEYIALSEPETENILIYIYEENGDEVKLENIQSEEQYEVISNEFMELFQDLFEDEEDSEDEE